MKTTEIIRQIERDFKKQNGPFMSVEFPEQRLLDELPHTTMEDRARLVSAFCTFDYNRNANQLVDNLIELHDQAEILFDAYYSPTEDELSGFFEDIGFRYPNRDSRAWSRNCEILQDEYNSQWTELLLSVSADAPSLVERLRDDDFLYLKGSKIAPMYARIIDDEVAPLSDVWDLEIPVDTHIRRLSKDLFSLSPGDDTTDDEIREIWRRYAMKKDIDRHVVDGGLWQIGNNWDDWGKDYWERLK